MLYTPIADAGFLLNVPLRLLFGVRMLVSEMVVWAVAITLNIVSLLFFSSYDDTPVLTRLLHAILTTAYSYWSVVVLSEAGTFLPIRFADEFMDVVHQRGRHFFKRRGYKQELLIFAVFILVFFAYDELIASLGLETTVVSAF